MKNLVILGCENTHAFDMMNVLEKENLRGEYNVIGAYSDEERMVNGMNDRFGVPVMKSFDEAVGKADGIIITARHGDNHYKYAAPYIASGVPMFIDKPITANADEAVKFMEELKAKGIKVTGGSVIAHQPETQELKKLVAGGEKGAVKGGNFLYPWDNDEKYGGFWFYTQHLVQTMLEIFGKDVTSVTAQQSGTSLSFTAAYPDFTVTGNFLYKNPTYYSEVYFEKERVSKLHAITVDSFYEDTKNELFRFLDLVAGGEMKESYEDLFRPVFVLDAIKQAYETGKETKVVYPE